LLILKLGGALNPFGEEGSIRGDGIVLLGFLSNVLGPNLISNK
jgi:hypothetical protein